jgi:hypothetical protein
MAVNAAGALGRLRDHAKAIKTVTFEVARIGEFKQAPPNGLCFAVWVQRLGSAPEGSGLASTTALMRCTARLYMPLTHKPEEDVELKPAAAADGYLARLNGDLTLGGTVRNVDVLSEMAEPLEWDFGHANIDNKLFRIADLPIGVIFNDAWEQVMP